MKVTIKGQGDVNLTQRDFVASGGQGSVYAVGNTAYKVYHDPSAMMPEGKIRELAPLPVSMFSRPEHLLLDKHGNPVGYTTGFITDAYVLCQLFPRVFREREGLTHAKSFALVEQMRDGIGIAHKASILLIDGNEMNFLVDSKFKRVTFIDTDSYQTRSYPATAIMESIRDRHMAHNMAFDEGTDWFSFACVSFQMMTGIHPYKGKHPQLKGFEARMSNNVSVFHRDVRVPKVAYDFGIIPKEWRAWYGAVFDRGERCPPPGGHTSVTLIKAVVKAITGATNLILEEIGSFDGTVTGVWASGHRLVVATDAGIWMDGRRVGDQQAVSNVGFSPKMGTPVAVQHPDTIPDLYDTVARKAVRFGLNASRVVSTPDGRVYMKTGDKVMEVELRDVGNQVMALTKLAATVLPNASLLFPGGVSQDMLGSQFISLFPRSGETYQVRIKELDDYRVLDAKFDVGNKGGVLMVLGMKGGNYDRIVFRFADKYTTYDVRTVSDVGQVGLNFVVTDAGVCVCLNEDDKIELSSVRKGSTAVKTVTDNVLGGDMRLFKRGAEVLVARGDRVYTMRMK